MKSRLQKFRQDEKTEKFFAAWKEITGTTSPADWSKKNEIPILCAFSKNLDNIRLYFSALNGKTQFVKETTLDSALKFICSENLSCLADKKSCEDAFKKYFCGEDYAKVIGVEDLREILQKRLGKDVYSWFDKKNICEARVKSLAEENYREKFLPVVREKVHELTAEEAQKYLAELIEKDTLLGIRVLKNSRGKHNG